MNKIKHISLTGPIRPILKWLTATRRRKILSSILAILIVLTSIRFVFFNEPKKVLAAKMEILETTDTIQIDVPNRYRAIMNKGDTDDYISFYDRSEDDSNPDLTHKIQGPREWTGSIEYLLRDDENRITTVLEATTNRIRIRVEGRFNDAAGTNYLQDSGADDDIEVTVEYTFTPQGVFIDNTTDFKDDGYDAGEYRWLQIELDLTDAAFDDTGNIIYGDGVTETTSSSGGTFSASNKYVVFPGNGSDTYQDAFVGIPLNGWFNNHRATVDRWDWAENVAGTEDKLDAAETEDNSYSHSAKWFLLFMDEGELDSETEREAVINDYRNPDFLSYTTGDTWYDGNGSPSLYLSTVNLPDFLQIYDADLSNDFPGKNGQTTDDFTITAWIKLEVSQYQMVAGKDIAGGRSFNFGPTTGGSPNRLTAQVYKTGGTGTNHTGNIGFPNGVWTHVAFSYDYVTDGTSEIRTYVNGEADTPNESAVGRVLGTTTNFRVGARDHTGDRGYFDGFIDDVRVYDAELTQAQIRADMHNQIAADTSNLVAYWTFNESVYAPNPLYTTASYDETSNNNDLTHYGERDWGASGAVSDQYNEAESAYPINASSNHAEFDFDGGVGASTLADGAVATASATITVDSTSNFPSEGFAHMEGDKFTYTGTTGTTFTGVPTTGESAVIGHNDNSIVSQPTRHDPSFKLRGYRNNNVPTEAVLEGERLQKDYDFLADIKPVTNAFFAQDLVFMAPLENTTVDIGTDLTNSDCSFVVGKYGQGLECNNSSEDVTFTSTGNIDYEKGVIEFWMQPLSDHTDNTQRTIFSIQSGGDQITFYKQNTNTLRFYTRNSGDGSIDTTIDSSNYSWSSGDWVHIRVEWDDNASVADQLRIFINGVEPTHNDDQENDDYDGSLITPGTTFRIGNESDTSEYHCNCIIDEFKIYDFNGSGDQAALEQIAEGGIGSNDYLKGDGQNYTFDFNDDDANNRGEYIWIGSDSRFTGVNIDLATDGVGTSLDFDWEYWTATQWAELTVAEQDSGASDFTGDGNFYFTDPGNWFPYSVNGSTDLYYIRGHLEGGSYTTDPIENKVLTDILLFQYTRYGGDITSENMTFEIPGWTSDAPPVAHWKFDEGYGTTANDTASNNYPLTIKDASWQEESLCISGKCLHYDGSEDQASRSAQLAELDFKETNSFTLSGWFRHASTVSGTDTLISKYESTGSDGGYKVYMNSSGYVCLGVDDDNTWGPDDSACSTSDQGSYADSKWHHFAASKTDTTQLDLYIDGNRVGYDDNISASSTLENNDGFYIGADEGGYQNYWDGFIDEVKVYRYARSADEIKADYTGGSQVFGDKTDWLSDGLVGYWPMDETSANSCGSNNDNCDHSGNDNHGDWTDDATVGNGKFGSGLVTDGVNDRLNIADDAIFDFDATQDYSWSFWLKPGIFTEWSTAWSQSLDTGNYFLIYAHTSSDESWGPVTEGLSVGILDDPGGDNVTLHSNDNVLSTSEFSHVVVTYDPLIPDQSERFKIYVNGVDQTDASDVTSSGTINTVSPNSIQISDNNEFGSQDLAATFDEVRYYHRLLSPAEIQDLYEWAPGPIAYYSFDEGTGTSTVYDRSGNGKNGTIYGSMTESDWVSGKFGNALEFDGSDDYIDVGSTNDFYAGSQNQLTIAGWVTFSDNDSNTRRIFTTMRTGSSTGISLGARNGGFFGLARAGGGSPLWLDATSTDNDSQWHHTAFVIDGSNGYLYIDGQLDNTTSSIDSGYTFTSGNSPANIATFDDGDSTTMWNGQIDDLKIYDYARTQEQIIEDMNAGHPAPGSPVGSAVGHWKFDEGYGITANDQTGNNNDLTLDSASWTNNGKFGKAWNGTGSVQMSRNDDDDFDFGAGESFSISLWLKSDGTTYTPPEAIIDKRNITTAGYRMGWSVNEEVTFGFDDDSSWQPDDQVGANSGYDSYDGNWHHIVAVKTGNTKLELYRDGVLIDIDSSISATGSLENSLNLRVGTSNDGSQDFNGDLDEIKIFRFALSADQVKAEYNQGSAQVFGATSTDSSNNPTWSSLDAYCPPGQGSSCTAPIGEWLLDEKTGSSTQDTTGNGNNGTISGATFHHAEPCHDGACLSFNGTSDNVNCVEATCGGTTGGGLDMGTRDWTVEAWIKLDSLPATIAMVASKIGDTEEGWAMMVDSSGYLDCVLRESGSIGCTNDGQTISLNEWTHVAVVFDRDGNAQRFVNGTNTGTNDSISSKSGNNVDSNVNFCIGTRDTAPGGDCDDGYLDGLIDSVRVYDYTRTPAQIAWSYNRGGPVGWWKFDECSGTNAYDSSGNGNTGTITEGGSGDNDGGVGTCSSGAGNEMWDNGTTGKRNASLDFDGNDDYIEDTIQLVSDYPFTFSAWLNSSTSANQSIFGVFDQSESTVYNNIRITGFNGSAAATSRNLSTVKTASSTTVVNDGNWHHVVGVFTSSNDRTIYVDGVLEGTNTENISYSSNIDVWTIGRRGSSSQDQYFDGQIDEVKIWNYALTDEQVRDDYNSGAVHFGP